MPDAILIIVTVQTVPGLKNLWTCPMTGSAPNAISTPINTTLLTVFIVGRFLGEDAVTATEGRRLPLHPGFYAAHECWGTFDVAARRLEAAETRATAVGDGDRPTLWCLFNSAHRTALSRVPQDAFGCARRRDSVTRHSAIIAPFLKLPSKMSPREPPGLAAESLRRLLQE